MKKRPSRSAASPGAPLHAITLSPRRRSQKSPIHSTASRRVAGPAAISRRRTPSWKPKSARSSIPGERVRLPFDKGVNPGRRGMGGHDGARFRIPSICLYRAVREPKYTGRASSIQSASKSRPRSSFSAPPSYHSRLVIGERRALVLPDAFKRGRRQRLPRGLTPPGALSSRCHDMNVRPGNAKKAGWRPKGPNPKRQPAGSPTA